MTRRLAALLLLLLAIAAPVGAQSHDAPRRGLRGLRWELLALGAAGGFDGASTVYAGSVVHRAEPSKRIEQNPLVGWAEPRIGLGGALSIGAAAEGLGVWLLCKWQCERHPRLVRWGLLGGAGVHLAYGAGNLRKAQRSIERQRSPAWQAAIGGR